MFCLLMTYLKKSGDDGFSEYRADLEIITILR